MSTVYILGAGASAFAGYPLAGQLWPFIRNHSGGEVMAEERRGDVISEMERLLRIRAPERHNNQPDLEALFTLLDLSLMLPGEVSIAPGDWRHSLDDNAHSGIARR